MSATTIPVRIPDDVYCEAKTMAGVTGSQIGEMLAAAWREYFAAHRQEFAADLEEAARIIRDGTLEDATRFAGRDAAARAKIAAKRARASRTDAPVPA